MKIVFTRKINKLQSCLESMNLCELNILLDKNHTYHNISFSGFSVPINSNRASQKLIICSFHASHILIICSYLESLKIKKAMSFLEVNWPPVHANLWQPIYMIRQYLMRVLPNLNAVPPLFFAIVSAVVGG